MKPESKAAVEWWAKAITGDKPHDNGDTTGHSFMACAMADLGASKNPVTPDQLEIFKQELGRSIDAMLEDGSWNIGAIGSDYGPGEPLASAAEAAGINSLVFPWKTWMDIEPGKVSVRAGYGSAPKTLYPG